MIFLKTNLQDAYLIEPEKREDDRGFFARAWCKNEFEAEGLVGSLVQSNLSFNKYKGTLRGMHFQLEPFSEVKLVRCTRGSVYDVIIDLRPASPTYQQWFGAELTPDNHKMMYVPQGFAHGYQTLEDDSEVFYQVSQFYTPGAEGGVRYDDPLFGIKWPLEVSNISDKDAIWPNYKIV
jgi:dTDP-4-dehydrorhamnose 3,5-epimerase